MWNPVFILVEAAQAGSLGPFVRLEAGEAEAVASKALGSFENKR